MKRASTKGRAMLNYQSDWRRTDLGLLLGGECHLYISKVFGVLIGFVRQR